MTGPSNPRSERAGTPGARWETELVWPGEQIIPDDAPDPKANRKTRRATRRRKK